MHFTNPTNIFSFTNSQDYSQSSQSQDYIPSTQSQETKIKDEELTKATDAEIQKSKGGRPKKLFKDLSSTTSRHERLKPIMDNCLKFCEEEELPFNEFLGHMGKYYYNTVGDDFTKAKLFDLISKGQNPYEKHSMSVARSLAFKDFCRLGQKPYDEVRKLLDPVLQLGRFKNINNYNNNSFLLTRLVSID